MDLFPDPASVVGRGTSVQILEGVQAGDTVLTTGILQLKPQSPVTVKVVNPTGQNQ